MGCKMSTDIGIRCKTCNEQTDTGIGEWYLPTMKQVIQLAPELKALIEKDKEQDLEIDLQYSWQGLSGLDPAKFLAEHAGHDLVVCNEYGDEYDEQGKRVKNVRV
jgi:hypothetical protein